MFTEDQMWDIALQHKEAFVKLQPVPGLTADDVIYMNAILQQHIKDTEGK